MDPLEQPPRHEGADAELLEWERQDREDEDRAAALEGKLSEQADRIAELERRWAELSERAALQGEQAGKLETELTDLRAQAGAAQAARRSAKAELHRAERRAEAAREELDQAREESSRRQADLEDRLREAAEAAADREGQLAALRESRVTLETELAGLRSELDSEQRAAKEVGRELRKTKEKLRSTRESGLSLEAENARLNADLESQLRASDSAALELKKTEEELTSMSAAATEAASQRERLGAERDRLDAERDRLAADLTALGERHQEVEAERSRTRQDAREAEARAQKLLVERRALVGDLVGTQGTLQARSDQLQRILESRWHRLARSAWNARRRRPPVVAVLLAIAALAAPVAALILGAGETWGLVSALLVGALLMILAGAAAVVIPAMRDRRTPRMAGDGSFARSLDDPAVTDLPTDKVEPAPVARPEPLPSGIRLVPRPVGDDTIEAERLAWLHGAGTSLSALRVAAILDEMSAASFGPECRLDTSFAATDWRERLEASPPHLLLVESAWSGNGGGWQYCVGSYTHPRFTGLPFLRELIEWCRENGIPTVFWNKEDPVHFDRFKEAAGLFDHVFTTDSNRIPDYEAIVGPACESVGSLQFGAQPSLHNPIPIVDRRRPEPVFAGTYYRDRHTERRRSLEAILDAARPRGLVIYDRTHGSDSDAYGFPERFAPHVRGRISYRETVDAYKSHRVFLNVNSVTDSPTMFSRRVFELLACGTPVISTPSVGMEALFGDLVPVARSEDEAARALDLLLDDDAHWAERSLRGQRFVLGGHTYRDRLLEVARTAGFKIPDGDGEDAAVIAAIEDAAELDGVIAAIERQTRAPDQVVIGISGDESLESVVRDRLSDGSPGGVRTVRQENGVEQQVRLQELAALATSRWVARLDPGAGAELLGNLLTCARFADAELIGLPSTDGSRANSYDTPVSTTAAIADRGLVVRRGWPTDVDEAGRWLAQGVRTYAADPRLGA